MKQQVKVIVDPGDPPVERTVLASSIVELSKAAKKLLNGPLSERALILLLCDSSRVRMDDVKAVLKALGTLEEDYTRPAARRAKARKRG